MRTLLYEVLTQAIVLLGRIRERLVPAERQYVVKARTFDLYAIEESVCCDCGLAHLVEHFRPGESCEHDPGAVGHVWPMRPDGYRYRLRAGAAAPDLAEDRR